MHPSDPSVYGVYEWAEYPQPQRGYGYYYTAPPRRYYTIGGYPPHGGQQNHPWCPPNQPRHPRTPGPRQPATQTTKPATSFAPGTVGHSVSSISNRLIPKISINTDI